MDGREKQPDEIPAKERVGLPQGFRGRIDARGEMSALESDLAREFAIIRKGVSRARAGSSPSHSARENKTE